MICNLLRKRVLGVSLASFQVFVCKVIFDKSHYDDGAGDDEVNDYDGDDDDDDNYDGCKERCFVTMTMKMRVLQIQCWLFHISNF